MGDSSTSSSEREEFQMGPRVGGTVDGSCRFCDLELRAAW